MKKMTQKEFDSIEKNEYGVKEIPSHTDLTDIKSFGKHCSFGKGCRFGYDCSFGENCGFGEHCRFGEYCSFGEHCSFGKGCRFGENCSFGECCRFGENCSFGWNCSFGKLCSFGKGCGFGEGCSFGKLCSFGGWCSFGKGCSFGEECSLGEGCLYNGVEFKKYYQFGGFGSVNRTTRVYLLTDNSVLIECGCQIGLTIEEFKDRVESEYEPNTEHGILYRQIIQTIESIISINKGE